MTEKLRIAWFSPLNTETAASASVSAYASDQVLPLLRDEFDITLFHNGFDRYRDFPTYHYLSAFVRHRERPYDFFFYQLEDQKSSNFIRVHMGQMPGMVWFHDLVFSTFGPEPILNSPWRQVVRKFQNAALPWPDREAEFEQHGPLGFREAAWAALPLFSNPVALSEYRRNIVDRLGPPDADTGYFVPLPVSGRPAGMGRQGEFRIGFCGSPRIEHRAHKIAQAISELPEQPKLVWLLLASEIEQARAIVEEFGLTRVELLPDRSPERWFELSATFDAAFHTVFSVYGQPDPYAAMSLMQGTPCLVTRFGPAEYLPENVVFKIEAGSQEVFQIREVLEALRAGRLPDLRARTRDFALGMYQTEHVARELSSVFRKEAARMANFQNRWELFERSANASLIADSPQFLHLASDWQRLLQPAFEEFRWKDS